MADTTTTYALVTLTMRVGIEHSDAFDPESVFKTLEVVKLKTLFGEVTCCDIVNGEDGIDVNIVEPS